MAKESRKDRKAAAAARSKERSITHARHAATKVAPAPPLPPPLTPEQVERAGQVIDRIVRDTCAETGRAIAQACQMYGTFGKDALAILYAADFQLIGGSLELRTGANTVVNGQSAMDNIGFISRLFPTSQQAFINGAFHIWLARSVVGGYELLDFSARQWTHLFAATGDLQPFQYPDTIHDIHASSQSDMIEGLTTRGYAHSADGAITRLARAYYEQQKGSAVEHDAFVANVRMVATMQEKGIELISVADVLPIKTVDAA